MFYKISDFVVRCLVREGFEECVNYLDDFCVVSRRIAWFAGALNFKDSKELQGG